MEKAARSLRMADWAWALKSKLLLSLIYWCIEIIGVTWQAYYSSDEVREICTKNNYSWHWWSVGGLFLLLSMIGQPLVCSPSSNNLFFRSSRSVHTHIDEERHEKRRRCDRCVVRTHSHACQMYRRFASMISLSRRTGGEKDKRRAFQHSKRWRVGASLALHYPIFSSFRSPLWKRIELATKTAKVFILFSVAFVRWQSSISHSLLLSLLLIAGGESHLFEFSDENAEVFDVRVNKEHSMWVFHSYCPLRKTCKR